MVGHLSRTPIQLFQLLSSLGVDPCLLWLCASNKVANVEKLFLQVQGITVYNGVSFPGGTSVIQ